MADDEVGRLRFDEIECNRIYDLYVGKLYAILCGRFGCNGYLLQDCVRSGIHDAFQELCHRPEIFRPEKSSAADPLLAFLVGMASRRVIDCLRAESRRKSDAAEQLDGDDEASGFIELVEDLHPHLNDIIEAFIDQRISTGEFVARLLVHEIDPILERLERLNDDQKAIWFLRHNAKLKVREIAELLNRKEDAVESMLKTIRRILLNGRTTG